MSEGLVTSDSNTEQVPSCHESQAAEADVTSDTFQSCSGTLPQTRIHSAESEEQVFYDRRSWGKECELPVYDLDEVEDVNNGATSSQIQKSDTAARSTSKNVATTNDKFHPLEPHYPYMGNGFPLDSVLFHDEDKIEEMVAGAIDSIQDGSFDEFSAKRFFENMKSLLEGESSVEYDSNVERFSLLVCARLNRLYVQERCRYGVNGVRFFYTALLLTQETVVWIKTTEGQGDVMMLVNYQDLETSLWRKLFPKTLITPHQYQEVLNILVELEGMVKKHYTHYPSVCFHLAHKTLEAFSKMLLEEKKFFDYTKHLTLIMTKCAISKGRYDIAGRFARLAAETYFNLESADANEIWAKCCEQRKDFKLAIEVAELALNCCVESDRARLKRYMHSLRYSMVQSVNIVTNYDEEWLQGTNVQHNAIEIQKKKAKESAETHQKNTKKNKRRTKAVPKKTKTAEEPKPYRDSRERTVNPIHGLSERVPQRLNFRRHEEVMVEVERWDEESNGVSDHSDTSDSEDDEAPLDDSDQYQDEEDFTQQSREDLGSSGMHTKTWFEESQELYSSGQDVDKLIVGESVDVEFYPSPQQIRSAARRYPLPKPIHELEELLNTQPELYKRCRIELDGPHKAMCTVLEAGQTTHKIEIHGRRKCGQTFNNDEVVVEVLQNNRSVGEDADKVFGQVVGVLYSKFCEKEFPLLACTNNPKEVDVMHPLCKSVPKIYIWQGRTKENHKNHQYRIDTYRIDDDGELQFHEYFDINPSKRGRYVFLVVFLTWLPHYTYPKGAVLKVLDCGTSFSSGLDVLFHQFQVPTYYTRETVNHVEELMKKSHMESRNGYMDMTKKAMFTIDPSQSKDLDDALSIWEKDGDFIVGVHIADVAAVVRKDDAVDKEARVRATSFYPAPGWRTNNMLPEPLIRHKLSLLPGQERKVISVFFQMDRNGHVTMEPLVKKCVIKSCRQFSYHEAKMIIDGRAEEVECETVLKDSIIQLHHLSQKIRKDRLKNSRLSVDFEDPRFGDFRDNLEDEEAHGLIEEFMIKANHYIASWLIKVDRTCVPIRCQSAPPDEELDSWMEEHDQVKDLLVQLQGKEMRGKKIDASRHVTNLHQKTSYVQLNKQVWTKILEALHNNNIHDLRKLLCCDKMHPRQCLAVSQWLAIMQSAVYRCSGDGDMTHFMLQIAPYTHFTSPIRRYIDLIVQRQVHAVLERQDTQPYTVEEVREICVDVSAAIKRQRRFDRSCQNVRKAEKLLKKPMIFDAVVETASDSSVTLCVPSLTHVGHRKNELAFNLLDLSKKPMERLNNANKTEVVASWNKRMYNYDTNAVQRNTGIYPSQIKSNLHSVFVKMTDVSRLLGAVFKSQTDLKPLARGLQTKGEICQLSDETGSRNVVFSTYVDSQVSVKHHSNFNLIFSPGQVLKVQMNATADQGILSPNVQLYQVCDNLSLCLSHVHEPIDTYAKHVPRSIRNRKFAKIEEYKNSWLPIVEMETVTTAVSSEQSVIVSNVRIHLIKQGHLILGKFAIEKDFYDNCKLEIGGKPVDRIKKLEDGDSLYKKSMKTKSMDYLCIRHTPQKNQVADIFPNESVWVGHAVVIDLKKKETKTQKKIVVVFRLSQSELCPPASLLSQDFKADVEVIYKSEVDRRTEKMLRSLKETGETLAKSIVLNKSFKQLGVSRSAMCRMSLKDIDRDLMLKNGVCMPSNNTNQTAAIRKSLESTFSLIQGPPGTGKTYTGLKLIYLFNAINEKMHKKGIEPEQKQVLFCGPSNKSVDLVTKYLMTKLGKLCPRIVRVYGKTIEQMDFPVPYRDIVSNRSMRGLKSDEDLRSVTLHYIIRKQGSYAQKLREYDVKFYKFFNDSKPPIVTLADVKMYLSIKVKAQKEVLQSCDVVLCTCAAAGSGKMIKALRISQCIIDESAMCPEPQSMIPIIATKPDQVVLIGDHKQLRPIVQCTRAAELGLDQSLFERYKESRAFLNIQYRMHPRICEFPSSQFYDGKLKTHEGEGAKWRVTRELSIWPVRSNPKVFCHVEGVEQTLTVSTEEGNEKSKSNMLEVEKMVDVFLYLVKTCKVNVKDINLMTQYNAQRSAVKERLRQLGYFDQPITTQTVVSSQGGEWDYVIFSTVRSLPRYKIEREATTGWLKHNLGFITDQNQINVALTRPRKGLIIIGNGHLLQCDPVWKKLLQMYKDEGCYKNAHEFPPRPPQPGRRRRRQLGDLEVGTPGVLPNPV